MITIPKPNTISDFDILLANRILDTMPGDWQIETADDTDWEVTFFPAKGNQTPIRVKGNLTYAVIKANQIWLNRWATKTDHPIKEQA